MKSPKALVVEHDEQNRQFIDDALTVLEHRYQAAMSLAEAYQMLEGSEEFAYILLADELPLRAGRRPRRQNAENFMAQLAKARAGRRPPVILMVSPMNGVSDIDKMRRAADLRSRGVVEFIENPLPNGSRTLERVVTKVLDAQAERARLLKAGLPFNGDGIIPVSALPPVFKQAMRAACDLAAAQTDAPATASQPRPAAESARKKEDRSRADPSVPAGASSQPPVVLSAAERNVLEAMSERPTESKLMVELVDAGGYSKNTTRKCLDRLRDCGYASRPCGPRSGFAITPKGLAVLGKPAPAEPAADK